MCPPLRRDVAKALVPARFTVPMGVPVNQKGLRNPG